MLIQTRLNSSFTRTNFLTAHTHVIQFDCAMSAKPKRPLDQKLQDCSNKFKTCSLSSCLTTHKFALSSKVFSPWLMVKFYKNSLTAMLQHHDQSAIKHTVRSQNLMVISFQKRVPCNLVPVSFTLVFALLKLSATLATGKMSKSQGSTNIC